MNEIQTCFAPAQRPVRVLQYGEGNFLRGFADWMIDILNEKGLFDGNIALVKPRPGSMERFRRQNGLYTVCLRGRTDAGVLRENRVITSIGDVLSAYEDYAAYAAYARLDTLRFVLSNTTEAGIVYDPDDRLAFEPPRSFPGKLTKLLYERAEHFAYDESRGLIVIPTELTDRNGALLKECVLRLARDWALGERFERWLGSACVFADTLVDRIVSGYSPAAAAELDYRDELMLVAEPFALWVIGADLSAELPFDRADLPVVFTRDVRPYKERKVRLLNGAHTSFVPSAFLAGYDIVRDALHSPLFLSFVRATLHGEVIPGLTGDGDGVRDCGGGRFSEKSGRPPRPLPKSDDLIRKETKEQLECGEEREGEEEDTEGQLGRESGEKREENSEQLGRESEEKREENGEQLGRESENKREEKVGSREDLLAFAQSVEQRFDNPFVDHRLLAITLNSVSKWRGRCLPSLLRYHELTGGIAPHLAFSLAALMAFDQPESREEGALIGSRSGQPYRILDEEAVLAFFWAHRSDDAPALTHAFLSQEAFWERDLTLVPGLEAYVAEALADIRAIGVQKAIEKRFA